MIWCLQNAASGAIGSQFTYKAFNQSVSRPACGAYRQRAKPIDFNAPASAQTDAAAESTATEPAAMDRAPSKRTPIAQEGDLLSEFFL